MSHIALYRLWRPQTFQDVVGQEHIIQTLHHSLQEGRINHAYLFSGPRGTGKTTAARIMAKAINCEHGPAMEPCNTCSACQRMTEGSVMDIIEIDAASNRRVEETRNLLEQVRYTPTEVRYKVYIIDEVHMLTTEAFNTLLKTLEEPPAHVIFILATTDPNRLPATIISRCQRFEFRRVNPEAQIERLAYICEQEKLEIEEAALHLIARLSRGGMRDALSLLDQLVSYAGGNITYDHVVEMTGGLDEEQFGQLIEAIHARDVGDVLEQITQMMSSGKSVDRAMESLIHYYRDLLFIKLLPDAKQLTERMIDATQFHAMASKLSEQEIFSAIDTLNHYHAEMRFASQPQTLFEVAILRLCTATPWQGSVANDGAGAAVAGSASAGGDVGSAGAGAIGGNAAIGGAVVGGDEGHPTAAGRAGVSPAAMARQAIEQQAAQRGTAGSATGSPPSTADTPPTGTAPSTPPAAPQAGTPSAGGAVPPAAQPGITPPEAPPTGTAPSTPPAASNRTAPETQGAAPTSRPAATQGGAAPSQYSTEQRRRSEFEVFLQGMEGSQIQQVAAEWSEVLAQVRKQKITVHAWLVDGEPVAATDQAVLVAFKNDIHRETTSKPDNTRLIEQVMANVIGQPMQLVTIMKSEWDELLPGADGEEVAQPEEQFALEPEPEQTGKHKEPWINEAIDLFGEHLVKIEEDETGD